MSKLRLSVRLILGVLLIQALVMGVLTWNAARLTEDSLNGLGDQALRDRSTLLAAALVPGLQQADRGLLLDALESLKDDASLRYAAVYGPGGEPLAALGQPPALREPAPAAFRARPADGLLAVEQPIRRRGQTLGVLRAGFAMDDTGRTLRRIWLQNTGVALLGLVLSTLAIVFTNLSLHRDLRLLANTAQALQRHHFEHRVALDSADAVGDAARAVNALAEDLARGQQHQRFQQEQLLQELRRLRTLFSGINAVVWEAEPNLARFRYVSEEAEGLLGWPTEAWLQEDFLALNVHPADLERVRGFLARPGNFAGSLNLDFRIRRREDDHRWLRLIGSVEAGDAGPVLRGLLLDVTDEKRNEQRIAHLADHDSLTGLINRRRFQEKLDEYIAYAQRYGTQGALVFIDLDQFKYINDTYGHHTGDEYLRQVSNHLQAHLRQTDVIGRLGGDEFGIILPNATEVQAGKVCRLLLQQMNSQEFIHDGRRIPFSASIGVALFPSHGHKASDLLAKADSAMYNAKEQGRNTYRVFQESTDVARMQDKIHWEDRIRNALRDNRFKLYFQPIVDIHSGQIRHYESLLRMIGENGELIAPGAFINIAERFGMIRDIDRWVVETAIRAQGSSVQLGSPVALTINLSGRHFGGTEMLELVQETTRRYHATPSGIVFEVTETAAVENFTDAVDFIGALRDMGYRFALDDFGAGFSSFHYLKHIPVDYVKIDGSFVRNLHRDRADRIFVKAIAEMAKGLNVTTIAEFVENRETVEILRKLGIALGQGYFFAKPAPEFVIEGRVAV